VRRGSDVVASRVFRNVRRARRVRDRFVAEAEQSFASGAPRTHTGWQALLDEQAMVD
jgi:hypothetical protein